MKKLQIAFVAVFTVLLAGCGSAPMTDADMAAKYGMTQEEFQEQKEAAARMNMSIEDHLKHASQGMEMDMDMGR
jgi:major membrane immunogen (membrane-anchored lipoprotein)